MLKIKSLSVAVFIFSGIMNFSFANVLGGEPSSCQFRRARLIEEKRNSYHIGNLNHTFSVSKKDLKGGNNSLEDLINKSKKDKDFFFDIELERKACEKLQEIVGGIQKLEGRRILSQSESLGVSPTCLKNMTMASVPLFYSLPSMENFGEILSQAVGLDHEKVEELQKETVRILEAHNPQTTQANSLSFALIFIEKLEELGVKKLDRNQLSYLKEIFRGELGSDKLSFLGDVIGGINEINFKRNRDDQLLAEISTRGESMVISSDDVPAELDSIFLKAVEIEDGTKLHYAKSKDGGDYKKVVKVKGVRVETILSSLASVRPDELAMDLGDEAPVKVKVNVLGFSPTFDMDY